MTSDGISGLVALAHPFLACRVAHEPFTRVPPVTLVERITVDPSQCDGRPCIRGMRIRVTDVLDLLASGLSREQVLEELPDLQPEDIERSIDHPVVVP